MPSTLGRPSFLRDVAVWIRRAGIQRTGTHSWLGSMHRPRAHRTSQISGLELFAEACSVPIAVSGEVVDKVLSNRDPLCSAIEDKDLSEVVGEGTVVTG